MGLIANTSVKLNIHSPKKDAVVAQPGTAAGANDIRIWVGSAIPLGLVQSIVGDFAKLHRMAQTTLKDLTGVANPDILHMPLGGGDNDILTNGSVTTSHLSLEIGTYTGAGDRSHFLARTFQRCIERFLEEAK